MIEKWETPFPLPSGKEPRTVYVYIPDEAEDNPDARYPVLYMFDGHNVFFDEDATYGKCWGMKEYMEEYLRPLLEDEGELLRTAKTYVLTGGRLEETAERLYCHKNTVRYRLARMQEILDPRSTEKEFFENLALAIRIHMLMEYK